MPLSTITEENVLDYLLTLGTFYIALFEGYPYDDDSGTEITGNSYAREEITLVRSGSTLENSGTVTFTTATGSWGTVAYFAIYDAAVAGTQIFNGELAEAFPVEVGDTVTIQPGTLIITID